MKCFCILKFTYSGVTRDPTHATMITITTVVVLFTTVVRFHLLNACVFSNYSMVWVHYLKICTLLQRWCYLGRVALWHELCIASIHFYEIQVFGFLTKPLIRCLLPLNQATNSASNSGPKFTEEDITLPLLSMEESAATNVLRAKDSLSMLMERPVYTIHFFWRKFDDYYMRPIFGGPCHSNQPSGSGC